MKRIGNSIFIYMQIKLTNRSLVQGHVVSFAEMAAKLLHMLKRLVWQARAPVPWLSLS